MANAWKVITPLVGFFAAAFALGIGLVLSGLTYILLAPLALLAIPVLFAIWQARRAGREEMPERSAGEPIELVSKDAPLVELVSEHHDHSIPHEERRTFDSAEKT
jgi:hypothetical protein